MTWTELITNGTQGNEVNVKLIKPVRNASHYKEGRLSGFKCGLIGNGRWIKRPKIHIVYSSGPWGKKQDSDWVDIDNCEFELIENKK